MNIPKRNTPQRAGMMILGAQKVQRLVRSVNPALASAPEPPSMIELAAPKRRPFFGRWKRGR